MSKPTEPGYTLILSDKTVDRLCGLTERLIDVALSFEERLNRQFARDSLADRVDDLTNRIDDLARAQEESTSALQQIANNTAKH